MRRKKEIELMGGKEGKKTPARSANAKAQSRGNVESGAGGVGESAGAFGLKGGRGANGTTKNWGGMRRDWGGQAGNRDRGKTEKKGKERFLVRTDYHNSRRKNGVLKKGMSRSPLQIIDEVADCRRDGGDEHGERNGEGGKN